MSPAAILLIILAPLSIVVIGWQRVMAVMAEQSYERGRYEAVRAERSRTLARAVQICRANAADARQQPVGEDLSDKERDRLKLRNETLAQACESCADDIRDEALGE